MLQRSILRCPPGRASAGGSLGPFFGGQLESPVGGDQSFDLVEIQRCASSSVAKSPTRDSGPYPIVTTTVHRPFLIILE